MRILVRRIEIDNDQIEVVFRVPPPDGPPQTNAPRKNRELATLYERW